MRRRDDRWWATCLVPLYLVCGLLACAEATADEPEVWADGMVAWVEGHDLAYDDLCLATLDHLEPEMRKGTGAASLTLRRVVESRVVTKEGRRLGVEVLEADVARALDRLDRRVWEASGGRTTLKEHLARQGVLFAVFEADLRHQLLKERIAAHASHAGDALPEAEGPRLAHIEKIVAALTEKAEVVLGLASPAGPARPLAAGVALTVDGEPVTRLTLGREVLLRLHVSRVREIIEAECKILLAVARDAVLTQAEMDKELLRAEELWRLEQQFDPEDLVETVTIHRGKEQHTEPTREEQRTSRFYRALVGLLKGLRDAAAEEHVADAWRRNQGLWGAHIAAIDIRIAFSQGSDPFGRTGGRTIGDARRLARDIVARLARGTDIAAIVRGIDEKRDPTFVAQGVRLYDTARNRLLYERATALEDGEVSSIFETLSEVHLLWRESARPAPAFETIEPIVRERLARERLREYFEEALTDRARVRIRWPLPEQAAGR